MRLAKTDFAAALAAAPPAAKAMTALLLAGFVFSTAINWPGHLSYDSILQLAEGRRGVYGNWHPPVMSWLLGVVDFFWRGPQLFVLLTELMAFGSLLAFGLIGGARHWAAPVLAGLFLLTPQLILYPAIVWKDVLFGASMLGGFAALLFGVRFWDEPLLRAASLTKAALLLALAALARQNGMLILLFAAAALSIALAGRARANRAAAGAAGGVLALILLFGLTFAGKALLALRSGEADGPAAQFHLLEAYDLIGALHADPQLALPSLHDDDPELENLMRSDGVRLYSPERNDTLAQSQKLSNAIWDAPDDAISTQWKAFILGHPGGYLAVRWAAFRQVFLTPDIKKCVPYDAGIDGPKDVIAWLHLKPRGNGRDAAIAGYGTIFFGTPVLNHGFWALVALGALVLTLRRRRPEDVVVAGAMGAALAFAASFFVISIACDYRYLYPLDLTAMAGALYVAGDWRGFVALWRRAPA